MNFIVKIYNIPIHRDEEGNVKHKEVKLDEDNFVEQEPIQCEFSADIPPKAMEITNWNNVQLAMAKNDSTINTVYKKVLCK